MELKYNPEIELENANAALQNLIRKNIGSSTRDEHQVRITTVLDESPLLVSINTLHSKHISFSENL